MYGDEYVYMIIFIKKEMSIHMVIIPVIVRIIKRLYKGLFLR